MNMSTADMDEIIRLERLEAVLSSVLDILDNWTDLSVERDFIRDRQRLLSDRLTEYGRRLRLSDN